MWRQCLLVSTSIDKSTGKLLKPLHAQTLIHSISIQLSFSIVSQGWNLDDVAAKPFTKMLQRNIDGLETLGACCESIIDDRESPQGCTETIHIILQLNIDGGGGSLRKLL